MIVYAILWQQVLMMLTLNEAYANKGVVMVWTILGSYFIFNETITINNVIGGIVIVFGVIMVAFNSTKMEEHDCDN